MPRALFLAVVTLMCGFVTLALMAGSAQSADAKPYQPRIDPASDQAEKALKRMGEILAKYPIVES